jgi:hypothetical protein
MGGVAGLRATHGPLEIAKRYISHPHAFWFFRQTAGYFLKRRLVDLSRTRLDQYQEVVLEKTLLMSEIAKRYISHPHAFWFFRQTAGYFLKRRLVDLSRTRLDQYQEVVLEKTLLMSEIISKEK